VAVPQTSFNTVVRVGEDYILDVLLQPHIISADEECLSQKPLSNLGWGLLRQETLDIGSI